MQEHPPRDVHLRYDEHGGGQSAQHGMVPHCRAHGENPIIWCIFISQPNKTCIAKCNGLSRKWLVIRDTVWWSATVKLTDCTIEGKKQCKATPKNCHWDVHSVYTRKLDVAVWLLFCICFWWDWCVFMSLGGTDRLRWSVVTGWGHNFYCGGHMLY